MRQLSSRESHRQALHRGSGKHFRPPSQLKHHRQPSNAHDATPRSPSAARKHSALRTCCPSISRTTCRASPPSSAAAQPLSRKVAFTFCGGQWRVQLKAWGRAGCYLASGRQGWAERRLAGRQPMPPHTWPCLVRNWNRMRLAVS